MKKFNEAMKKLKDFRKYLGKAEYDRLDGLLEIDKIIKEFEAFETGQKEKIDPFSMGSCKKAKDCTICIYWNGGSNFRDCKNFEEI